MRSIILAGLIVFASQMQATAQTTLTMPPSTYPEQGAFCGFLTPCTSKARPVSKGSKAAEREEAVTPPSLPTRR